MLWRFADAPLKKNLSSSDESIHEEMWREQWGVGVGMGEMTYSLSIRVRDVEVPPPLL